MDSKQALGKQVQHLRRRKQFSQEELAAQIGIDPKSLSRLERGSHFPALETLDRIREVLDVSWGDLFEFDERPSAEALRGRLIRRVEDAGYEELLMLAAALDAVAGA